MGWLFLHEAKEKRQVIEACTKGNETYTCIKKATHGNLLWTIWRDNRTQKKSIVLFMLGKEQGSWGYKDITEEMGPVKYDCPLRFLDLVPGGNPDWRAKVRAHHEHTTKRREMIRDLEVGKMVRLRGATPGEFRVTSLNPLLGVAANGDTYKLIKNRITEVL